MEFFVLNINLMKILKEKINVKFKLINNINTTNYKIKNLVFSIKYSEKEDDIDGKLIIGEYTQEYDSKNYDVKEYKKDSLNLNNNNNFQTIYKEIYFFKNNKKISIEKPEDLYTIFTLEQNMFMVPREFFTLYKENFFEDYIKRDICYYMYIDLSKYRATICDKEKIESLDDFYDNFPNAYFFHF